MHRNRVVRLAIASALTGAGVMSFFDNGFYAAAAIVASAFAAVLYFGWRKSK